MRMTATVSVDFEDSAMVVAEIAELLIALSRYMLLC
jgi:hypothetical protein